MAANMSQLRFPTRSCCFLELSRRIWARQPHEAIYRQTCRNYASPPSRRSNFFSQFVENVRQEMARNKEMKESLKKFREEAQRLEESEALKKARQKFHAVESEASRSSDAIKEKLSSLKEHLQDAMEEASKSDIAKKAGELSEDLGKKAKGAAESLSETGQKLGQSGAFRALSETAEAVKQELRETRLHGRVYRPPVQLRKRKEPLFGDVEGQKEFAPNTEATGVELHKDSRFYESWQNFKDNNPYVHKVLDWKMKYEESENPVIRASRLLTDKVSDLMGGLFQKTELSEALTEICRLDPEFNKERFLHEQCERDIIPNVLEAIVRGDLEILSDWCHEAPFSILATPIRQSQQKGLVSHSRILDIDQVDLAMGKVMEQGPVLIITFTSQQIICLKDREGKVVEGDSEKVMRVYYVWVLCRDQSELDPKAAWKLMDLSANATEQLL